MRPADRVPSNKMSEEVKSERPLRQKERYHRSCSVNKPGFCEALSAAALHYTWRTKCYVRRQSKCIPPAAPSLVLPDRVGAGPAPEGHVAAAFSPTFAATASEFWERTTALSELLMVTRNTAASYAGATRKTDKDLYKRQILQLLYSLKQIFHPAQWFIFSRIIFAASDVSHFFRNSISKVRL